MKMRLLTHNMLKSNIRGVVNGYPLKIEGTNIEEEPAEYNEDMVKRMSMKIDWNGFKSSLKDLSISDSHIDSVNEINDEVLLNELFLKSVHHYLFELRVVDGYLICPETSRKFPIKDGIPNMLLHEDEV